MEFSGVRFDEEGGYIQMKKKAERALGLMIGIMIIILLLILCIRVVMYPECYISTWKYQLMNEVRAGDPAAVEYYEAKYLANGIELWEE